MLYRLHHSSVVASLAKFLDLIHLSFKPLVTAYLLWFSAVDGLALRYHTCNLLSLSTSTCYNLCCTNGWRSTECYMVSHPFVSLSNYMFLRLELKSLTIISIFKSFLWGFFIHLFFYHELENKKNFCILSCSDAHTLISITWYVHFYLCEKVQDKDSWLNVYCRSMVNGVTLNPTSRVACVSCRNAFTMVGYFLYDQFHLLIPIFSMWYLVY